MPENILSAFKQQHQESAAARRPATSTPSWQEILLARKLAGRQAGRPAYRQSILLTVWLAGCSSDMECWQT